MKEKDYKIAIIGAGPSGGILGAFLAQKGLDVTLIDVWKDHMQVIKEKGLEIVGHSKLTVKFDSDHLMNSILELKGTDINLIFIATKTPFLRQIVIDLKDALTEEALLVSHQNGLHTEQILANTFGEERSFRVVINYAGNMIKPGKIDMTFFNPPNFIGAVTPNSNNLARSIAEIMSSSDFQTDYVEDIQPAVWKKVILNAALAPVCAITGQTMKEAMDLNETYNLASKIIKEGIAVTSAIGVSFDPDFHDICMGYLSKGGHHKPSMLIDIEHKRLTEITYLNGKIVELGKQHNIPVPFNEATVAYMHALESKY
ncbi:MAG: ketopantoate reductase family protein [Candidatus Hodarchaeales archaeon]|jgi:2-dehydropantoate 2-reductase